MLIPVVGRSLATVVGCPVSPKLGELLARIEDGGPIDGTADGNSLPSVVKWLLGLELQNMVGFTVGSLLGVEVSSFDGPEEKGFRLCCLDFF